MTFLTAAGKPLSIAGVLLALAESEGNVVTPDPGAALPSTNLVGLWDASTLAPGARGTITDASTAGKNASVSATKPAVVARVFGAYAGLYDAGYPSNYTVRQPVIDDFTINATGIAIGAGQAFTLAMAWTRPNQRQPSRGAFSTTAVDLLKINGTSIIRLAAAGAGSDALTLFPDSSAPVSAGALAIRHTMWLKLVFNGSSVDLHLNGAKIITAAASQITLGSTANLAFLPSAQCIFHKAAAWSKAHNTTEDAAVASNMQPFAFGARRAANILLMGQSNAALIAGSYGLLPDFNAFVTYLTGVPSVNVLMGQYNINGSTVFSGQGLYDGSNGLILNNSGGGDPSTWPLGGNGNTLMSAIDGMTADERDNLSSVLWFWSENDSLMLTYAKKAEYMAALKRAFSLIRAKLGRTPAQLPFMVLNALPFNTDVGRQTHREAMQDVVNDATQNVRFVLANSDDAIGQGDTWNSSTGLESGNGNSVHRDADGMSRYLRRMAAPSARAIVAGIVARGVPDAATALDAALPVTGGPKIASAHWEGGTSVLVTLAHDGGTDIIVPLRAALGVGWELMDGVSDTVAGTPGAPGTRIKATACARVSATQLRLTLASAPIHAAKGLLYYDYGSGVDAATNYVVIGNGNGVTDNFASVVLPAGWKIASDLGASYQINHIVQATTYGVALS